LPVWAEIDGHRNVRQSVDEHLVVIISVRLKITAGEPRQSVHADAHACAKDDRDFAGSCAWYKAERREIAARYAAWEITGPPEIRARRSSIQPLEMCIRDWLFSARSGRLLTCVR
jgi:hypothetical protein